METSETKLLQKVRWRIVPVCFILYVIAYIDRANIGYAALQMNAELGLTAEAFGFAAGIFFIGYFLFEVPSNVLLLKFGARVWIARILITWGIVSVGTGFVTTEWQLYLVRFLLGIAEAGFFPAIVIYFTAWFRSKEQATVLSLFTAAIPVSYVLGAPISTFIIDHVSGLGLAGWRWMFIIEGAPAVLGGIWTYKYLPNRPADAKWLTDDEKAWLETQIEREHTLTSSRSDLGMWQALLDPRVLFLALIYFVYQTGSLGVGYWMPQVLKASSANLSNFKIGLFAALPYMIATIAMIVWSKRSDKTGERRMHTAWPLLIAGIALVALQWVSGLWASLGMLAVALSGFYAFKSPFWTLPGKFLTRSSAAVAIAAINSIGNLGGFVGPYVVGYVTKQASSAIGLSLLGLLTVASFAMVCLAPLSPRRNEEVSH